MKINYRGIEIEIQGEYVPAEGDGTNDEHHPAYYEIDMALIEGVNIGELLSEAQWDELEKLCLESCK